MPELPEVETICRGLATQILQQPISKVLIRQPQLRWEIPKIITSTLPGVCFMSITRRGKYLLLETKAGTLIIHLGLTGNLRVLPENHPFQPHEHLRIYFTSQKALCFIDPRRFGACLWTKNDSSLHPLIASLGQEPLTPEFNCDLLVTKIKNRKTPIKQLLMDSHVVTGIGNIYASEALFLARIHPLTPAKNLTNAHCTTLVTVIKQVLSAAIEQGGTTIRDYINSEGQSGHFQQKLNVYGRTKQPCQNCQTPIEEIRLGQRSTFYCPKCQQLQ